MSSLADINERPPYDEIIDIITQYVMSNQEQSELAMQTAYHCFIDTIGCGLLALSFPECTKHLGPVVPGASMPHGVKIPGTGYQLDPIKAAFDIGCMIRWLDFNDTWLAAEWGHPSDNLGGILATAAWLSQVRREQGHPPINLRTVFESMIMAHEIQGVLAIGNSFNKVGLDHVLLVKVASTAVIAKLLDCTVEQTRAALSLAWVDGQSLRTYRHAPNTGSRKSWAAGDATSRALRLVLMAQKGEMGCPGVLSAQNWGFQDVLFKGNDVVLSQPLESYVMENVLFKISFPAEFHAQTAVEAAVILHKQVQSRLDEIERIEITTHESAIRIISKTGKLANPADRDHCLQYMAAIGLIYGNLTAQHYEQTIADNPQIDALRSKMVVSEDKRYSKDYLDLNKRSIANKLQVFFKDGTQSQAVEVEYPLGHRSRREEGIPLLVEKYQRNLATVYGSVKTQEIIDQTNSLDQLSAMPTDDFLDMMAK